MVDERRLIRILRDVTSAVSTLRDRASVGKPGVLADTVLLDSVKYVLVTAIEGAIRASQHTAASEGWEAPATNADSFRVLAAHGVIDKALAGRLAAAAGFRNLLIHQYGDIDNERVVGHLDGLSDLDEFVDAVTSWLERGESGEGDPPAVDETASDAPAAARGERGEGEGDQ